MSTYPTESECLRILKDAGCKRRVIIHCCTVRTVAEEMIKKIIHDNLTEYFNYEFKLDVK